jgi:hypothetical protein
LIFSQHQDEANMTTYRPKHVPRAILDPETQDQVARAYATGAIPSDHVLVCPLDHDSSGGRDWLVRDISKLKRVRRHSLHTRIFGPDPFIAEHIPLLAEVEMSWVQSRQKISEAARHKLPRIESVVPLLMIALPSGVVVLPSLDEPWTSGPVQDEMGGCMLYIDRPASHHEHLAKQAQIDDDLLLIERIVTPRLSSSPARRDRFIPSISLEV